MSNKIFVLCKYFGGVYILLYAKFVVIYFVVAKFTFVVFYINFYVNLNFLLIFIFYVKLYFQI